MLTSEVTPVSVGAPGQWIVGCDSPLNFVVMMLEVMARIVTFYFLGGTNHVHFVISELDLPRDQIVAVHEVDADNVVVQLVYDIHWVSEFLSLDPEVHLIDPYGVHCISGWGDATLSVRDFPQFLVPKSGVK